MMCGYVGEVPLVHAGIGIRTIWIVTQTLIYVAAAAAAKSLQSCPTQALPALGFSRLEHWSGLPFPSAMNACGPVDGSPPGPSVEWWSKKILLSKK